MARARKTYKSRAQIARAMRERRDNARAVAEGRPMPYPNIWDVLDPTKAPPNATDEQIRESYLAFRALCPPPTRRRLALCSTTRTCSRGWRELEVNVISASTGLKDPETGMDLARELPLPGHPGVSVLVADPFQLLTNKLSVNRAKDRPHIAVLRRFLEEEIVHSFEHASTPRERIVPAQRYLRITRQRTFDDKIARRLLPLARNPPELRFLVDCAPSAALADALIERAEDAALREELVAIRKKRRFQ